MFSLFRNHGFLKLGIAFTLTTLVAFGQQGVGTKYGARDPKSCPSQKEPTKGVLTPQQAAKYLTCGVEKESRGLLYLMQDVKVEIGKGTPFRDLANINRPGTADPDGSIYQIRGSYKQYACSPVQEKAAYQLANAGKNCILYDEPKATGSCFRDNFGEWICKWDFASNRGTSDQAPPAK